MFSWFVALFRGGVFDVFVWVRNFHCLMLFHWSCFYGRTLWICGSLLQTSFLSSIRFWWICVNSYQAARGAWDGGGGWIIGSSLIEPLPWIRAWTKKTVQRQSLLFNTNIMNDCWQIANSAFAVLDGPLKTQSKEHPPDPSGLINMLSFPWLAGIKEYEIPKLWRSQLLACNAKRRIWAAFFFNDGLCMTREVNNMTAKIREGICVIHVNPRLLAKPLGVSF